MKHQIREEFEGERKVEGNNSVHLIIILNTVRRRKQNLDKYYTGSHKNFIFPGKDIKTLNTIKFPSTGALLC